jgi:hypothetical protein
MMNKTVEKSMQWLLSSLLILLLISCNNSNNKPNVSNIKVDANILRFDKDFFSMDTNRLVQSLNELNRKYPSFLPLYSEFLSPIEPMVKQGGQTYEEAVLIYYRTIKPLYEAVQKKYSNLDNVQKELEEGLKYVKHYYPSFKTPAVVASVESFNPDDPNLVYGTVFYHDTLILRLQMFMGKDFDQYDQNLYPDYLRRRFNEEFIAPNSLRAIANTIYPDSSEAAPLIEQMIEKGKQWFLLDKFLPDTPDSLKTGYTRIQTEFVEKEEGNIWGEFLKNTPDPYTVEQERLKNYLGEGPFTQDMPHDLEGHGAPGNIGQWIGWRIVQKFAESNPKMSVQEILATPARTIFQQAKYKPK